MWICNFTYDIVISVIVPVYNVERFIAQCVESVLNQTYSDWELILVDDGSTDLSGSICEEFVTKDDRIKCVHKVNGGVTDARKTGWELSRGDWIFFVDGDDTLPEDSLTKLYDRTKNVDADIIEGHHEIRRNLPDIHSVDDYRKCLLRGVDVVGVAVWGKLFRREILTSWCFEIPREIVRGEDWIMNIRVAFLTKKTPVLISDKIYNYRENDMSLTHVHKKNMNLEYAFFHSWRDSVPSGEQKKYIQDVVRIAVLMFVGVCVGNLKDVTVVDSAFAKEINQLTLSNNYNLRIHQKVLLYSKRKWLRVYVWKLHCLKMRILSSM